MALTIDPNTVKSQYITNTPDAFLKLETMPSFPNDKGSVIILNVQGNIIDEINYSIVLRNIFNCLSAHFTFFTNQLKKTMATIMLVAMLTLSAAGVTALSPQDDPTSKRHGNDKQLERLYKHHDRKMELRASVLGVPADTLREKLKDQNFDQLIKQSGFKDRQSFHKALIGKMKEELRNRGWDDSRVQKFIDKRLSRYTKNDQG